MLKFSNASALFDELVSTGLAVRLTDDGQSLSVTPATRITDDQRQRIRAHKAELVALLRGKNEIEKLTPEAAIRAWLAHIGENDADIIAETIQRCRDNPEVRAYFLGRSREVPQPDRDPFDDRHLRGIQTQRQNEDRTCLML